MIVKFSLGIFFSIDLLGDGKLILSISITDIKIRINKNIILIKNFVIEPKFPGLVFF